MRIQLVKEKCPQEFRFLVDEFGFREPQVTGDEAEVRHIWLNSKAGVELVFDVHEQGLYLYIHRLVHGRMVDDDEDPDAPLNYFSIEDILEVRDPEEDLTDLVVQEELSAPRFEANLRHLGQVLQEHCADLLKGNFRLFEQLEAIERQRRMPDA